MKTSIAAVAFLLLPASGIPLYAAMPGNGLDTVIANERNFASAATKGITEAFLAFAADDATILRPHPVHAKQWLTEHPFPPGRLRWQPCLAIVSSGGDLAFTSGPSEWRSLQDTAGPPSYGEFVTAWRRQKDGTWKFAFDAGVSHDKEPECGESVERLAPLWTGSTPRTAENGALMQADSAVFLSSRSVGMLLDDEVRLLRPGTMTLRGKATAMKGLASDSFPTVRSMAGKYSSTSGDLAYTYGRSRRMHQEGKQTSAYYFSIWRRASDGSWKLLIDVCGRPLPE